MEKKENLEDVTFLIPVRLDSIVRLENLIVITEYLLKHFKTNICVLEASGYNNSILSKLLSKEVNILWKEDFDPIFYRTHYINDLVNHCKTQVVAVWDADVIVPANEISESVNLIRNREADFVCPFHKFLDTSEIVRELFLKTKKIETLKSNEAKMKSLYSPEPIGGAYVARKDAYIETGLENENFYGWGIEDGERVRRWIILGYVHKRVRGVLYHLTHDRGKNSQFHSDEQYNVKTNELHRITAMSREELTNEVKQWKQE